MSLFYVQVTVPVTIRPSVRPPPMRCNAPQHNNRILPSCLLSPRSWLSSPSLPTCLRDEGTSSRIEIWSLRWLCDCGSSRAVGLNQPFTWFRNLTFNIHLDWTDSKYQKLIESNALEKRGNYPLTDLYSPHLFLKTSMNDIFSQSNWSLINWAP